MKKLEETLPKLKSGEFSYAATVGSLGLDKELFQKAWDETPDYRGDDFLEGRK